MEYQIKHSPSYSMLEIKLAAGEKVIGEAGAMVAMDTTVTPETKMGGGCLYSLSRKIFGGESVFITEFRGPGEVLLSPTLVGEVRQHKLAGNELIMEAGAFLASTPGVTIAPKWAGCSSFFGGDTWNSNLPNTMPLALG